MANYEDDLERLGDAIEAIIDQAVSSRNYQKLNQTIRQAVDSAVSTGGEAVRRAMDEAADRSAAEKREAYRRRSRSKQVNKNIYSSRIHYANVPEEEQPQESQLPSVYNQTDAMKVKGILMTVFGGILTFFGLMDCMASAVVGGIFGNIGFLPATLPGLLGLAGCIGGGILLGKGIGKLTRMNRFKRYMQTLGNKTYAEVKALAGAVGKPVRFVRKDLKQMIDDGLFVEGHLDQEENSLITSDDTYTHYLEVQQREAIRQQEETMRTIHKQKQEAAQKVSDEVQEVLDKGNAFVAEIRSCNAAIPGEEISRKISRMETIVEKIFDRARTHPEIVPKLKKLMDYYLPMTVKLLNAYSDMDAQPIQGDNIQKSKQEIEATLDTLNDAFEKLLDSVFQETAMDVSSDISVLQSLLAQEGLTDDGLTTAAR